MDLIFGGGSPILHFGVTGLLVEAASLIIYIEGLTVQEADYSVVSDLRSEGTHI